MYKIIVLVMIGFWGFIQFGSMLEDERVYSEVMFGWRLWEVLDLYGGIGTAALAGDMVVHRPFSAEYVVGARVEVRGAPFR